MIKLKAKAHRAKGRLLLTFCLLPFAFFLLEACGARRTPNLERIFAEARSRTGKRPLIVIPGILGSQLVNYATGEVVAPPAFRPADDGPSLPLSPALAASRD